MNVGCSALRLNTMTIRNNTRDDLALREIPAERQSFTTHLTVLYHCFIMRMRIQNYVISTYAVESLRTDTSIIQTPPYYGQFIGSR